MRRQIAVISLILIFSFKVAENSLMEPLDVEDKVEEEVEEWDIMIQALIVVESHNKWRRDNNVPPKARMANPKKLGVALDVLLIVAKDYCKIYDMDRVQIKPKTTELK